MNDQAAAELSKHRLFRPLATPSPHYPRYSNDLELAEQIVTWTKNILLGGHHYDLGVSLGHVFQVQSDVLNRIVYLIPVWDSELVAEIALRAERKTSRAQKGCGGGPIDKLKIAGGILVLKRSFTRGTRAYRASHESSTGWFVEDRYHMDIFFEASGLQRAVSKEQRGGKHRPQPAIPLQRVLRVFHDSLGCVEIPHLSPDSNIDVHNASIAEVLPEYYPPADELLVDWHELAQLLQVENTGIYAVANANAALESDLFSPATIRVAVSGEYYESDGQLSTVRLTPDLIDPFAALPIEFIRHYARFRAQFFTALLNMPLPVPFIVDTYTRTRPPAGPLGQAVLNFLLDRSGGAAVYQGNGLFRMRSTNGMHLAAGTGNWGSAENASIGISWEDITGQQDSGGGSGQVGEAQGVTGLTVDLVRYIMRDDVAQEIGDCRETGVTAVCVECIHDSSTVDTFHDVGVVADFVDTVAGVAACIVASIFGHPWVCGLTLPSAIASAQDFWDNTFGDYDYATDLCYGLPDQVDDGGDNDDCVWKQVRRGVAPDWRDPDVPQETKDQYALGRCREVLGSIDDEGRELKAARYEARPGERSGIAHCKYCPPNVA